jgi:glycosyltransferase involved in cell wall biosynthesis
MMPRRPSTPTKPKRDRVIFFSPGFSEQGGAARRARILATELSRRGWDVRVVTKAETLRRPRLTEHPNLRVLEVPGWGARRVGAVAFVIVALCCGALWGSRAKAFLALTLVSPSMAAALCAGLWRRPFVGMTSTSGLLSEVDYVLDSKVAPLRRTLLGRAAYLVAQSPEAAVELQRLACDRQIKVVPNPVRAPDVTPLDGQPRALYSGRFAAEKDLGRLLTAWEGIATDEPAAELRLVGAGGSRRSVEDDLRAQVALSPVLSRSVIFTGWVSDVDAQLRRADVYAFPSRTEGMSNALLEACAARRIVVASDIPANRAVLGEDYPLLFATGDTAALATTLRAALSDDRLRAAASQRIEQRLSLFSITRVVDEIETLLRAPNR